MHDRIRFPALIAGLVLCVVTGWTGPGAAPVEAQEPDRMRRPPAAMRSHDPIRRLLSVRDELELSVEQVEALNEIREELRVRNEPLRRRIREAMADLRSERLDSARHAAGETGEARRRSGEEPTPERREAMRAESERLRAASRAERQRFREERRQRMQALRPEITQLNENTRSAMQRALALLTSEQRATLEALRERRRERHGPPAAAAAPPG